MAEKYIPRLQKLYKDEIVSSLMKELNLWTSSLKFF